MPIRQALLTEKDRPVIDQEKLALKKQPQPVSLSAEAPTPDGILARWIAPFIGKIDNGILIDIETLVADLEKKTERAQCVLSIEGTMGRKTFSMPFKAVQGKNVVNDSIDLLTGDVIKLRVKVLSHKDPSVTPIIAGVCMTFMYSHRKI